MVILWNKNLKIQLGIFFSCVVIFIGIFSLYDLELEAVFYASGLSILLILVVFCINYYIARKRHKNYQEILKNIELKYQDLPVPTTITEKDCQELVLQMGKINQEMKTRWNHERQESLDYYTTWVHQIKTPIAVMQMILQGEDTDEHRELSAQLFRVEQYVEMVLSYLRIDSPDSDFVFKECDLDKIIKSCIHKYAPQFIRKRIRLIYEPVNQKVLTDEKWLTFIIEQLLSNAIKYTMTGSVTISVNENQVLSICDTGIGIEAEDLPRIFEKGFTGYNGRADKKSTGLGLYLCKKVADKLSISIQVKSKVGEGSTFLLDLHTNPLEIE